VLIGRGGVELSSISVTLDKNLFDFRGLQIQLKTLLAYVFACWRLNVFWIKHRAVEEVTVKTMIKEPVGDLNYFILR